MASSSSTGAADPLKRIPACDTCKLRKLKCPRANVEEVCTRCVDKGIRCTTTLSNKPRKQRGGRRIDEARQTFGAACEIPDFANIDTGQQPIIGENPLGGIDWNLITAWDSNLLPTPTNLFAHPSAQSSVPSNTGYSDDSRNTQFHSNTQYEDNDTDSLSIALKNANSEDIFSQAFPDQNTFNQLIHRSQSQGALSYSGSNSRLATTEISSSLADHLIQTFFDSGHSLTLLIDFTAFQAAWNGAGRRPEQLENPSLEVLCYSMMSMGSRISAHPLLLGTKTPQISASDINVGQDLTQWGLRRESICRDFFRKALDVSNEKKITDLTSLESIAASSIIWEMVLDRQSEGFKPRTYASNMFAQIRSLVDEMDPNIAQQAVEKLFSKGFALNLILRDIGVAAATGQLPNVTENDIALFQPDYVPGGALPAKADIYEAYMSPGNEYKKAVVLRSILYRHLDMKKSIFKHLTSAKAVKNKEINLNKVREIWQIVDSEKELLDALRDVLRFSHNTWLYPIICILRMDLSHNTATVNQKIRERIPFEAKEASKARGAVSELGVDGKPFRIPPNDSTELYWIQLTEIEEQSRYRLFVEALSIVDTVAQVIISTPIFRSVLLMKLIHVDLSTWIRTLSETPIEEYGGPYGYTPERKSAALRTLRDMCEVMGWSWSEMRDFITEINQATEVKLEDFLVEAPEAFMSWP